LTIIFNRNTRYDGCGNTKKLALLNMKLNIDLEEKGPEGLVAAEKNRPFYPEFTFREADEPEFPDEGTMTIRYKKVRTSMDKKSDKPYSCTLEVREIVSAEGEKDDSPTKKYDEAGPALDKLAASKVKKSDEDY